MKEIIQIHEGNWQLRSIYTHYWDTLSECSCLEIHTTETRVKLLPAYTRWSRNNKNRNICVTLFTLMTSLLALYIYSNAVWERNMVSLSGRRSALQCLTHERRALAVYESRHQHCQHLPDRFAWTSFYKSRSVKSPDRCLDVWYYLPNIESARADRQHLNVSVARDLLLQTDLVCLFFIHQVAFSWLGTQRFLYTLTLLYKCNILLL